MRTRTVIKISAKSLVAAVLFIALFSCTTIPAPEDTEGSVLVLPTIRNSSIEGSSGGPFVVTLTPAGTPDAIAEKVVSPTTDEIIFDDLQAGDYRLNFFRRSGTSFRDGHPSPEYVSVPAEGLVISTQYIEFLVSEAGDGDTIANGNWETLGTVEEEAVRSSLSEHENYSAWQVSLSPPRSGES